MDLKQAQRTYLLTDPTLAGLVSSRIYPNFIPQDATLPAVAYIEIGGPAGILAHDASKLGEARIQYTITAETYPAATAVAAAIRNALWGYRGLMGTLQVDGVVDVSGDMDGYNQPDNLQVIRLDAKFIYQIS